jgi:hypothetical protein
MTHEETQEVRVPIEVQSPGSLSDQENSGKFNTLTEADREIILRGFSEFGVKEYKINFLEITDQELFEKLKTYYSEPKDLNHKTQVLILGSGHLQDELRGRLAFACATEFEGFNRSEAVETEAHRALSTLKIDVLIQARAKLIGINRRESLIDSDIMCPPVIKDNAIYPKKSPNSYSEVQKQQAFFNKRKRN